MTRPPTLWHLPDSHFSEKARWALDRKRLPHVRRASPPGIHMAVALVLTGRPTLPVLVLDGETTGGSHAIIARLDGLRPDLPLLPDDPAQRSRALELEAFFDEQLGPFIRRFSLSHLLRDTDLCVALTAPAAGPLVRRTLRMAVPGLRRLLFARYGITPDAVAIARRRTLDALDRLEAEIGPGGHLVGDAFSVADLTAAAMLGPLLRPPGSPWQPLPWLPVALQALRDEVDSRPAGAWARSMYAHHRRPGASR